MDAKLLVRFFGTGGEWFGPCVVILDADAGVKASGPDSIVSGGMKSYAPRLVSGRVPADAVLLMPDQSALLVVQQFRDKKSTGEIATKQTLMVIDPTHIVAIEFTDFSALKVLGVSMPVLDMSEYREGQLVG